MAKHNLDKIKQQFQFWLAFGAIFTLLVSASFLNLILNHSIPLLWKMAGVGVTISVFWWFWVMSLVHQVLKIKRHEEQIMKEMLEEIQILKLELERLSDQNKY